MGHSKVKRIIYIEGDVSKLLDEVASAQDANSSRLAARLIKEGLERRLEAARQIQAVESAGVGSAALGIVAILAASLA